MKIVCRTQETESIIKIVSILRRRLRERFNVNDQAADKSDMTLTLDIQPGIGTEGYKITVVGNQVTVIGNDNRGLLYGVGKFLRTLRYEGSKWVPGSWQGVSVPEKPVRLLYFATHFQNFYAEAPIEEVEAYLEDLALWGYNGLLVWFDMHHYTGIKDPKAQAFICRLRALLNSATKLGLTPGLVALSNEGYSTTPNELRATHPGRGFYGCEICPNKSGGTELILKNIDEEFSAFADLPIGYFGMASYDQGGCGCEQCKPWGGNGYLKITRAVADLYRSRFPSGKVFLATWLFDEDDWKGMAEAFKTKPEWVDYLLADAHETFPKYLLENPVPGNLPLINFPEISMWNAWPWGAYGASPLPNRFERLWNSVRDKVSGGLPYSEGIYEDINKIIYSQFYWDRNSRAADALHEYVSFELSVEFADAILEAVEIMEKNHGLSTWAWATRPGSPKIIVVNPEDHGAEKAYKLMKSVDAKLPEATRKCWRWRILLLRAMFDYELRRNKGKINDIMEAGFHELCNLYHAEKGTPQIRPPVNAEQYYPLVDRKVVF